MGASAIINNPAIAGHLASKKELFGEFNRFAVAAVHTRFDLVQWFVWDSEKLDEYDMVAVIRQEPTKEAAMAGLIN